MPKHLLSTLIFLCFSVFCVAQDFNYSTIDESLINELESSSDDLFDIYILLEDKVDFAKLNQSLDDQRASRRLRAKTIINALQGKAENSQASLVDMLQKEAGVQKGSVTPYWLANVIFLRSDRETLAKLSNDVRIAYIGIDGKLELEAVEEESAALVEPDDVEIGLERINVRPLWELGYTGYGQLALVADTGIDPTHSSFRNRYRGNTTSDSEAWYAWLNQRESPFQCGDHGTHVLGTVLGLDRETSDTIGVAFDAQWLGSANLCGGGTQSNIGTFQWAVNPDNNSDTTDDMADVINNSWWDPSVTNSECNGIYVDVLEALEAVGVVVVFSAGNDGPDPETITAPKNISINLVNTFSVGALTGNNPTLPVAGFSSRGPSVCSGEGALAIKPEVSAPGVNVRSAVLDNGYGLKSGTSMAAPHVSGAVLILRQAFPEIGAREVKLALYNTCRDLGEPGEDNTFGMGVIDVFAAYNYLIAEGNVPTPPNSAQNDVMAYDFITNGIECDEMLTGELSFFNNTADTIFNMEIEFFINGEINNELSTVWEGSVAPFSLDTIMFDALSLSDGEYTVAVEISKPNGNLDERPLNNMTSNLVVISAQKGLEIVEVEDQVACEGANILLKANYSGSGVVQWFDQIEGGNLIAEGSQVVVEADQSRTIYGHTLNKENVGKIYDASSDDLAMSNDRGVGITFDGFAPFRVSSFDFYSESTGVIIAALQDGRGDQILSEIIQSDGSGWQTEEVNWQLLEGVGYRLVYENGTIELGATNSDAEYPYAIDNIIEITGNIFAPNQSYPYFFNLQVEYLDLCGAVAVHIDAVETDSLPVANFEMDFNEINLNSNQAVTFTNNSTNGTSYLWEFDDGSTSEDENPSHTYTEVGTYYVSLRTTNDDGCSDSFVQTVEVFSTTSILGQAAIQNSFELAPNPFTQRLNFKTDTPMLVNQVELFNSAGVLVQTFRVDSNITFHSQEMSDLVPGLYYILIHTEAGVDTHKVVKH